MNNDESKIKLMRAYQKKIDGLRNVFALTKGVRFDGSEEDAERYVALMERREEIFEEIGRQDRVIVSYGSEDIWKNSAAGFRKEAEQFNKEIKNLAAQIIHLDSEMSKKTAQMTEALKKGLKKLNEGQNVSRLYHADAIQGSGSSFDAVQ